MDKNTRVENKGADKTDKEEPNPLFSTASIPYIQGLSENIRRLLRGYIRTTFKSSWTLRRMLTNVKDPVQPEERTGVIYKISCICGDAYIQSINEHKDQGTQGSQQAAKFERSAVAEHAWQDDHSIEWDSVEILDTAAGFISRRTKEALHIRLRTTCRMNRDE